MGGGVRKEATLLLGLFGIAGLAMTQPLLDVFGKEPEQFVFRGVGPGAMVLFAVAIIAIPALVLYIVSALVSWVAPPLRTAVHSLLIGVLVTAWVAQLSAPVSGFDVGLALVLGVVGAIAFARFETIRQWAAVTAVFQLLYLASFVFLLPSADLIRSGEVAAVELEQVEPDAADEPVADPFADVMIVLLDELPISTLLGSDGTVQPLRYPNIAAFADDATWYPRFTTPSAQTKHALPSIVTGQLPIEDGAALWTEHPDNLFRLLANAYHLTVSESFSKLCAPTFCPQEPVAPPAPVEAVVDESAVEEDSEIEVEVDRGGVEALLGDAMSLWFDRLDAPASDVPLHSGFAEVAEITPVTTTTLNPTAEVDSTFVGDASSLVEDIVNSNGQIQRVEQFVQALGPSSEPVLSLLHLVLPHVPLVFNEDGGRYQAADLDTGWAAEWDSIMSRQRHGWQAQLADAAVGAVLDEMRANGTYDDALIIVMADHGASFDPEEPFRYFSGTNAADLMTPPLFIKYPQQTNGAVSDASAEATDILATIADVLGVEIPWEHDGRSLVGRDAPESDCDQRTYVRFGVGLFGDDNGTEAIPVCFADIAADALRPALPDLTVDHEYASDALGALTPYPDLVGSSMSDHVSGPSGHTGSIAEAETFAVFGGAIPPGMVYGSLSGDPDAAWVAVAVNDRIVGVSPVYGRTELSFFDRGGDDEHTVDQFLAPVPLQLLESGPNQVAVAVIEGDRDDPVLTSVDLSGSGF